LNFSSAIDFASFLGRAFDDAAGKAAGKVPDEVTGEMTCVATGEVTGEMTGKAETGETIEKFVGDSAHRFLRRTCDVAGEDFCYLTPNKASKRVVLAATGVIWAEPHTALETG
jgi:hypothetical protein